MGRFFFLTNTTKKKVTTSASKRGGGLAVALATFLTELFLRRTPFVVESTVTVFCSNMVPVRDDKGLSSC
jgi:hypothetical protein